MNLFKRLRPTPPQHREEIQEWTPDELTRGGYRMVMDYLRGGYDEGFDRDEECLFLRLGWL